MAVASTETIAPGPLVERVQELQERLAAMTDGAGGTVAQLADELVSAVVQMYGAGLDRMMAVLFDNGAAGERIALALADDELVATLLLIHDLHPTPLADRVQSALDSVRPYMESHGGNVELLSLHNGVARIHLQGSCSDCSASAVTLELAIKQALEEAAPDLEGLEVAGITAQTAGGSGLPMVSGTAPARPTGMELPVVMSEPAPPTWHELRSVTALADGAMTTAAIAGSELVIANVDGTLLAYRNRCSGCGAPLDQGALTDGALACPGCGRSFFLPRAGRSLGDEQLQLDPVPLLRDQGRVKVAL